MPRPNPLRPLRGEANLARRVAYERQRAGMSTEGLAKRMTDLGCAINQSAIWKIENGNPPRRITYDEALAFAEVFGVALEDLSVPPELAADRTALQLLDGYFRARVEQIDNFAKLMEHLADHPSAAGIVAEYLDQKDTAEVQATADGMRTRWASLNDMWAWLPDGKRFDG